MKVLTLSDLGERLQMLRKALELSQKDLAATFEVNQNFISRFENGKGGSIEFLFTLFNFYRGHFHLNSMLSDEFEIVKKSDPNSEISTFHSIAVERLKILQSDFGQEITEIIQIIEKQDG